MRAKAKVKVQLMDKTGRQPSDAEDVRRRLREGGCRGREQVQSMGEGRLIEQSVTRSAAMASA